MLFRSNTAYTQANTAYTQANLVFGVANASFNQSNIIFTAANAAFFNSNNAYDKANAAHLTANTSYIKANAAHLTANTAYDKANSGSSIANAAFDFANTRYSSSGGVISGDVSITGNLTITGNTVIANTSSLRISDPLIYLAGNNYTSDIVDIGFVANYVNATGQNVHTGLFRDASLKEYYLFQGYDKEPDAFNDIQPYSNGFSLSVLNADLRTSNLNLAGTNTILWLRSSYDTANAAFLNSNIAFDQANTGYNQANLVFNVSNLAYVKANTANYYTYLVDVNTAASFIQIGRAHV